MRREVFRVVIFVFGFFIFAGCASYDSQRRVKSMSAGKQEGGGGTGPVIVPIDGGPVAPQIIERPIYVPADNAPSTLTFSSGDRVKDTQRQIAAGILEPSQYSRAAVIYDFDPDWVYEVYTQPLRASDIMLEPGEQAKAPPFISDSVRWLVGAGVNYSGNVATQHIYVKPTESGLEATLIINTDRRVYHIILRSYQLTHMPIVRWRYPAPPMVNSFDFEKPQGSSGVTGAVGGGGVEVRQAQVSVYQPEVIDAKDLPGIDPRMVSFDYKVTWGLFRKPRWLPEFVYDDGKKTYITFPEDVLHDTFPVITENRYDIVNYRVADNIVIIDKRIEKVTVRQGKTQITIVKKKK